MRSTIPCRLRLLDFTGNNSWLPVRVTGIRMLSCLKTNGKEGEAYQ